MFGVPALIASISGAAGIFDAAIGAKALDKAAAVDTVLGVHFSWDSIEKTLRARGLQNSSIVDSEQWANAANIACRAYLEYAGAANAAPVYDPLSRMYIVRADALFDRQAVGQRGPLPPATVAPPPEAPLPSPKDATCSNPSTDLFSRDHALFEPAHEKMHPVEHRALHYRQSVYASTDPKPHRF